MAKHGNSLSIERTDTSHLESLSLQELVAQCAAQAVELASLRARPEPKKFGLVWEDQVEQFDTDTVGKLPLLVRNKSMCVHGDPSKQSHVLIRGNNYHALTALSFTHWKSVDVIYIDPPYNTGNKDFRYNDKYVDEEDGYRHSKWLSFLNKRLRLAKELLRPDGVVFISIDEFERAHLELLGKEVFPRFLGEFIWDKRSQKGGAAAISTSHEHILVFANHEFAGFKEVDKPNAVAMHDAALRIPRDHGQRSDLMADRIAR